MKSLIFYFIPLLAWAEVDCLEVLRGSFKPEVLEHAKHFKLWTKEESILIYTHSNKQHTLVGPYKTNCHKVQKIPTPPKKIIAFSTNHLHWLEIISAHDRLVAFPEKKYISSKKIMNHMTKNNVLDLGMIPKVETILALNPDVVIASSFNQTHLTKLKSDKVKRVQADDFLEETPLARAEWVKFFGALLGEYKKAKESYFYTSIFYKARKKEFSKESRPAVLVGYFFNGRWTAPSGGSDFAQMIHDAGGEYIYSSSETKVYRDFESVIKEMKIADIWILQNNWKSTHEMLAFDKRYEVLIKHFKGRIYNNSRMLNARGGNDYWEKGIARPDLVLLDLAKIFHPNNHLTKNYKLQWYLNVK